ncbi:Glycoside hydrolase family 1, partial [Dillenia turbinata]
VLYDIFEVEGAAAEDGRTPSIWDTFAHSGRVPGNGDTACDSYHKYKEDVQLMVDTGLEGYRFSISWSRLIPNGRGPVNSKGLAYYNNLIDELISHGSFAQQNGFIGINIYPIGTFPATNMTEDELAAKRVNEFFIGDTSPFEVPVIPLGLQQVLEYFKQVYGNPTLYIHENGYGADHSSSLNDTERVEYMQGYIGGVLESLRNGSNTRGYFSWSFLDVYELLTGYQTSCGLYYVDFNDKDLKRYPKFSAYWYSNFLKGRSADAYLDFELGQFPATSSQNHFIQGYSVMTMLSLSFSLFCLLNFAATVLSSGNSFTRKDFPSSPDFVFGSGTSAYQVEGAAFEDGRTPSIFDTYAHSDIVPGNGDITCDGYHKYKEDVKLMAETDLEAYRFSISWSRLIPNGRGPVNPKGLEYYNNLINELITHGQKDFTAYADVCFREFGDRVKYWSTMNEGNIFVLGGYDEGISPPRRCSYPFGFFCTKGNSTTEPYLAAHYILLSHGSAAKLYKKKYQAKQNGFIGINVYAFGYSPLTNSTEDLAATRRALDFFIGCNSLIIYPVIPWGLQGVLEYFKEKYGNPPLYIHENGQRTESRTTTLNDTSRVLYIQGYIGSLLDAMRNGSNTKGYFVWSFLDLFELLEGYQSSYGLYHVDFNDTDLKRAPKLSAHWYSNFLKGNGIGSHGEIQVEKNTFSYAHLSQ